MGEFIFDRRFTVGHLVLSVSMLFGGWMYIDSIADVGQANAAEIDKQAELQALKDEHIAAELKEIKQLVKELRDREMKGG